MKKHNYKKGFTLIETLVAISILMLAVTGPMYFATESLKAATYARDQITAFYLAQDAFEQVRAIRDNNKKNISSSVDFQNLFSSCSLGCKVDPFTSSLDMNLNPCNGGVCEPIKLGSNGEYWYSPSGIPTPFTRTIVITPTSLNSASPDSDEVKVTVTITWKSGTIDRTFPAYEFLRNVN